MRDIIFFLVTFFLLFCSPQAVPLVQALKIVHDVSSKSLIRINLTEAATQNGAVCLDGTPATYYYHPGSGNATKNWIIYHQGGAWCYDFKSCAKRANSSLGSTAMEDASTSLDQSEWFSGMMSQNPESNPDFYNWNLVYMRYCDGASFSGNVYEPLELSPGGANIFFRGQRIWEAIISDLMENRGLKSAEKALLTGCSARGLAAMIHCDQFRGVMPNTTSVKCLSDTGFFLDQRNVDGEHFLRGLFASTVSLQNVTGSLHPDCTYGREDSQMWQCFFPQYFVPFVKTPTYILNSAYDSWQISNSLIPAHDWGDSHGQWKDCYSSFNFSACTDEQLPHILGFWEDMSSIVSKVVSGLLEENGAYVFSCRVHCVGQQRWTKGIRVNNMTPAKAVGDWYFERNITSKIQIGHALPTDSSCMD